MRRTRRFKSIGFRLSVIVSAIVFVSIVGLAGLFVIKDFQKTVASERERLTSTAQAFSAAAANGVRDRDRRTVLEVLRGIRALPDITYVEVYAADGMPVAQIGEALALVGRDGEASDKGYFGFLLAHSLTTRVPVVSAGEEVGALEIKATIDSLRARYFENLAQMIVIGLAAIALTGLVANMMIRRLTRPITAMSKALVKMGDDPNLGQRFDHNANDEVGVLAQAFNKAFGAIEERDLAIRRHSETLEETVEIRTAELKEAVIEAERANAAKSDFLATMSHEIRTPMNGMLVMAELLAAAPLAEKQRRYAQVISRSGQSLLNIINDILDMSKIEAGRLELEEVPFSIDTLVEDTVSLFSVRAHEKGLTLAVTIEPGVATSFVGDPTRLGQVISNLTNNALKFTEQGGVTISVSVLEGDGREGQAVRVAVTDTGIGIAEEKLNTIFEAFSQADQTITRNFGGTGLGLSISRQLVQAMGGVLQVESTLGEGATFFFDVTLPVDVAAEPIIAEGATVLLLDDNRVTRKASETALGARGIVVANDGDADAVLGRPHLLASHVAGDAFSGEPVVLLRPYGLDIDAGAMRDVAAGEMALPLMRREIDRLCRALSGRDFAGFAAAPEPAGPQSATRADFGSLSVLAVDDNAVNREVLNEALTALGIRAVFASSGEQAIETFAGKSFDIVFMDCSMPGMDGYQATARLREIETQEGRTPVRVVALTAHVTGSEAERWRSAGMDGYVAKPFTIDQLGAELSQVGADELPEPASIEPAVAPAAATVQPEAALISPETLEMFEMVSSANGVDMKTKVFSLFIANAPDGMQQVHDASAEGVEPKELAALIHSLKSMCASAGAARAAAVCERLEKAAKDGVPPSEDDLASLQDAVDQTVIAMWDEVAPADAAAAAR